MTVNSYLSFRRASSLCHKLSAICYANEHKFRQIERLMQALWFLLPAIAAVIALLAIMILTPFAERLNLLDRPNARKKHESPVPMVGGIAIYMALMSALLVVQPPEKLTWFIASGTLLVIVGFLDDALDLGVKTRFFVQIIATLLAMTGTGVWITSLGLVGLEWISLSFLGIPLTLVAAVGLTNAFNMADGIDGLASGYALVAIMCVACVMHLTQSTIVHLEWLAVLFSVCFAFWLVNMALTPLKKVFLGDAGSLLLGFLVAWLLVYYSQEPVSMIHPVAALWCVAIPVWDTLIVMARRIRRGRSPFSPDRHHIHHLLVDSGLSSRAALACLLGASVVIHAAGLSVTYQMGPWYGLTLYGLSLLGVGTWIVRPAFKRSMAFMVRGSRAL